AEETPSIWSSGDGEGHEAVVEPVVGVAAGVVVLDVETATVQERVALDAVARRALLDHDPENVEVGRVALQRVARGACLEIEPAEAPADRVILNRVLGRGGALVDETDPPVPVPGA